MTGPAPAHPAGAGAVSTHAALGGDTTTYPAAGGEAPADHAAAGDASAHAGGEAPADPAAAGQAATHPATARDAGTHRTSADRRRIVPANGLEISVDVRGAGPPLVLLHGASSGGRADFGPQLPSLVRAFQVFMPDARGHGGTRWDPSAGLRYEDLVADLAALADALGLATFHLAGFSMGGATALAFAALHPERVRTLVLVGVANQHEPRTSVIRRSADVARIEAHDPGWADRLAHAHDPVQGPGGWRRLMPAIVAMVEAQGLLPPAGLHRVDMPALVVVGDRDPYVPVGQAWELARQLPDARLHVVPDCGHVVMVQRPTLFMEGCAAFWRSTAEVAARRA